MPNTSYIKDLGRHFRTIKNRKSKNVNRINFHSNLILSANMICLLCTYNDSQDKIFTKIVNLFILFLYVIWCVTH